MNLNDLILPKAFNFELPNDVVKVVIAKEVMYKTIVTDYKINTTSLWFIYKTPDPFTVLIACNNSDLTTNKFETLIGIQSFQNIIPLLSYYSKNSNKEELHNELGALITTCSYYTTL